MPPGMAWKDYGDNEALPWYEIGVVPGTHEREGLRDS